ncbi:tetratricopeptide repeat protein [Alisedimentitalea sp. MJ-SS2]|uniref:tetratricopeptide repeat protein n=1 Tax=Aliisedimentitalea sp. MJ-SS2 TaxID=3049795 RepID=UPI00290FAE0C|nr:tetratricopeptide repeat protein [Alisedimentitalea sp. MJ-SS2]MDU8926086.1 tetratricopeptide repeat protein [Alisedimentitalea sp. MJ-SS2]
MIRAGTLLTCVALLAGCSAPLSTSHDSPFAPGIKKNAQAVDGLVVGHRLMQAGEYELAFDAFTRAAATEGMNVDVVSALGSANIGLGRLGQAEKLLRRAIKMDDAIPETWNNLGVVLMEKGEYAEAEQILRRAYALDNGESDSIRDNLRLALAKTENPDYGEVQEQDYKLVRRGSSDFLIRQIP